MSKRGIHIFAKVLETAQTSRDELFRLATAKVGELDKTDICLAQLLDKMKDSIKEEFYKLTIEK
jgi:hypothetical protein